LAVCSALELEAHNASLAVQTLSMKLERLCATVMIVLDMFLTLILRAVRALQVKYLIQVHVRIVQMTIA